MQTIRYKVISSIDADIFESKLYKFTSKHPNYAIQYKPVGLNRVVYTALISYADEDDQLDVTPEDIS